jgi:hypothetical protein
LLSVLSGSRVYLGMKRLTWLCALVGLTTALATTGCRKSDDDAFRGGVPTRETVALHLPGAADSGGALTIQGGVQSALVGEKADMYTATRLVTAVVNGGTWAVLSLVRTIVAFPATSVHADTAVWGPGTDALSARTWRLTVKRLEPHKFHWLLEARAKTQGDGAFLTIVSGTHDAALDAQGDPIEGFGNGAFLIDWDADAMVPEHDPKNVGQAAFTYSRLTSDAVVTIAVDFTGIKDEKGQIFNAVYRYTSTPGQGGDLRYAEDKDNVPDPGNTGTAKEHFTIHSRWTEMGVGRSDLQDSGGDLMTTVAHASECWDSNFLSVYRYAEYPDKLGNWGAESDCGAFPAAQYAGL